MFKMIDALDTFVELDVPFLIDERRQRVQGLRTLMNNRMLHQLKNIEKFLKLMK